MQSKGHPFKRAQRYLLTGILTVIPLWITWVVLEFFWVRLSDAGRPWAQALATQLEHKHPDLSAFITTPWLQNIIAIVFIVVALYLLGWLTTLVIGRRLIGLFEVLIERIPLVKSLYGSVKKLITVLQTKPDGGQRVVLIEFPSKDMKTVGFITRILIDEQTGRQLAAVYVPTTPNPTSGYLEIVPLENLVMTNWSMDEAMTFIISGGAVAPEKISYDKPNKE
jgi:uncharacterized membrane protein